MARDQELSVKLTGDSSDLAKATNDAAKALSDLNTDIKKVDASSIEITADVDLDRVNRDIGNLRKVLDGIEARKVEVDADMDLTQLLKDEAKVRKALDDLEERRVEISVDMETTGDLDTGGLEDASFRTAALTAGFEEAGDELGNLSGAVGGVGTAFAAWKLVDLAADVETTKISLSSLTGSAEEGAAAFEDLQKFAATTPYELNQVTTAARSLLAAGVEAGELPTMLTDLGNAASAVSAPLDEVALVFQQMYAKGKISNEELLQLAERQVPAYDALATALGVTTAEVIEMATAGELGTKEIELLSQSLGDMFPTSMADQAASFNGQMSTLMDNLTQVGGNLGAVVLPAMKDLVGAFNDILGPLADFTARFKELPKPVQEVVGKLITITALVSGGAFFGAKAIGALTAMKTALTGVGTTAALTASKLKLLGGGLVIGATLIGIDMLDEKFSDLFDTLYDAKDVDRELEHLANTGQVTGEMAKTFGTDLSGVGKQLDNLTSTVPKVEDALFGFLPGDTSVEKYTENIEALDQQLAAMVESGNISGAARVFDEIAASAEAEGVSLKDVEGKFDDYTLAVENSTYATGGAADSQQEAADAAAAHAEQMALLTQEVDEATAKFEDLREEFSAVNQLMVDSRSAVYDYEGALDTLRKSMEDNNTFTPNTEAGRTNWNNLVQVATAASEQVKQVWQRDGREAAMAVYREQREAMHEMLTNAGVSSKRAWTLVNQTFEKPIKVKVELGRIDLAELNVQKKRLEKEKVKIFAQAELPADATEEAFSRAVRAAMADVEPVNAKIRANAENIQETNEAIGNVAKPGGKDREAKIQTVVEGHVFVKKVLDDVAKDRYSTVYVNVVRSSEGGGGGGGPSPGTEMVAPVAPSGSPMLMTAGAALLAAPAAAPYFGPYAAEGLVPRDGGTAGGGSRVMLAPKTTPIAVYLDGHEIADRLELRRSLAAVESVRRTA